MDLLDSINKARDLCPDKRDVFDSSYLTDLARIGRCMGPYIKSAISGDNPTPFSLPYDAVVTRVAADAMLIMESTDFRFWSEGDLTDELITSWARTVWRFLLVFPIGFLVSNYSIKVHRTGKSWNPALCDVDEFSDGQRTFVISSNRQLSGNVISAGIFARLFDGFAREDMCPMHSLALLDAFGSRPNPDNPIIRSAKRAISKVILVDQAVRVSLPYWLLEAINALFIADPAFVPITGGQTKRSEHAGIVRQKTPPSGEAPPMSIKTNSQQDLAPKQDLSVIELALHQIKLWIQNEPHLINGKRGALFHVWRDALWITAPLAWHRIAERLGKDAEFGTQLESLADKAGYLERHPGTGDLYIRAAVVPPGKSKAVAMLTISKLSDAAVKILLPTGLDGLQNNEDLQPPPSKA